MLNYIKYDTHAVLGGLRTPTSDGSRAVVIARGKLSDVIKQALKLSDAEYSVLNIAFMDGVLWNKNEMMEISERPNFPKG